MKKALFVILLFVSALTFAQIPKPLPNTYVNDYAHVLTDDQVIALNQSIAQIEQNATVQFAVVIINKLPQDTTIEQYTQLIGRTWHVGTNKNGLVYVAAIQDHKQRLKGASGLDGAFTKQVSLDILNAIKPSFRNNDYYSGLQTLVDQVAKIMKVKIVPSQQQDQQQAQVQQQPTAQPQQRVVYANQGDDDNGFGIFSFVAIGFIILIVILMIRAIFRGNARRRPPYRNPNFDPGYDDMGPPASGGGFFWGTLMGALGLYTADRLINNDDVDQQYDNDNNVDYNDENSNNNDDSSSSSWGDWGGGSDSSSDSGFSDSSSDSSDSGSSSDW